MHALDVGVHFNSGFVSTVVHSDSAEVDGHSCFGTVGGVAVAGSVAMAALLGSGLLADFVELVHYPGSY